MMSLRPEPALIQRGNEVLKGEPFKAADLETAFRRGAAVHFSDLRIRLARSW